MLPVGVPVTSEFAQTNFPWKTIPEIVIQQAIAAAESSYIPLVPDPQQNIGDGWAIWNLRQGELPLAGAVEILVVRGKRNQS